jgi:hypothetical protein
LLDQGEATCGLTARTRGQHVIVSRLDEIDPIPASAALRPAAADAVCYLTSVTERSRSPTKALNELVDGRSILE